MLPLSSVSSAEATKADTEFQQRTDEALLSRFALPARELETGGRCEELAQRAEGLDIAAAQAEVFTAREALQAAQLNLASTITAQPSRDELAQARFAVELAITRLQTADTRYVRFGAGSFAEPVDELQRDELVTAHGRGRGVNSAADFLAVATDHYKQLRRAADPVTIRRATDSVTSAEVSFQLASTALAQALQDRSMVGLPCADLDLGQPEGSPGLVDEPSGDTPAAPPVLPERMAAGPETGTSPNALLSARPIESDLEADGRLGIRTLLQDSNAITYLWVLNGVLLAGVILFALALGLYALATSAISMRFRYSILEVKEKLARLAGADARFVDVQLAHVAGSLGWDALLDLTERHGTSVPEVLHRAWRDALQRANAITVIEAMAGASGAGGMRRVKALRCLHFLGSPRTEDLLRRGLDDPDPVVVSGAITALASIKDRWSVSALADYLYLHPTCGQRIAGLLEAHPAEVASELLWLLDHADERVRYWVVKLISRLRPTDVGDRMVALIWDGSPDVRAAVCECVGQLGLQNEVPALLERLADDVWFVRLHAVRALGSLTGAKHVDMLVQLFDEEESSEVKRAIRHIMRGDMERALPHLEWWLREGDDETKRCCIDLIHEADYLPAILDNIIYGGVQASERSSRLLEALIRSGFYFGLKRVLDLYDRRDQVRIRELVVSIDRELGERLVAGDATS